MQEILYILVNSTTLDQAISEATGKVISVALKLTGVFFILMLIFTYVKSVLEKSSINLQMIWSNVLWTLLVICLLAIYKPITGIIDGLMMGIYVEIKSEEDPEGLEKLGNLMNEVERNQKTLQEGGEVETPIGVTIKNWWTSFSVSGALLGGVNFILSLALKSVGVVMMALALVITKLLKVIGPLSLVFSILPFARGVAGKWLGGILNAYGAVIVIAIIDTILNAFTDALFSSSAFALDTISLVVLTFITLGVYLTAFKYASYIVGEDAGSMAISMGMKAMEVISGTAVAQKLTSLISKTSEAGEHGSAAADAGESLLGSTK